MIVQFSPMASAPITVPHRVRQEQPASMRTLGETSMPKQSRLSAAKNFANNRSGRRPYVISARRRGLQAPCAGSGNPQSRPKGYRRGPIAHAAIARDVCPQLTHRTAHEKRGNNKYELY